MTLHLCLLVGVAKRHKAITGSSGATSGLSSSLAFTPVQGIELGVPLQAARKDVQDRYFGSGTDFLNVKKKS
jgi:U4/U6 small nuclear ribonucleoprotein PRP31